MKKLKIGNFHVKDIRFGDKTSFNGGVLTVNKEEAVAWLMKDDRIKNVELHIAKPGESVRIVPAKAAVEPRFRPDGRCIFPGYTGPVSSCGDGVVYALKDMCVIASGKYGCQGDGLLDMSGPGARNSYFSQLLNLVVYAERVNEKELELAYREEDELRMAAYSLAEYVAKSLEGQIPEEWEEYELEPGAEEGEKKGLPRVAFYMISVTQYANGINDKILGQDGHNMMPILLHPNELLDGVMLIGRGLCGQSPATYDCQNMPVVKRLFAEHGKTVNFVGVVVAPCEVSDSMKQAIKIRCGELAEYMRLDGAIVAEWGGGSNADVDLFYELAELEDRGVKSVGLMAEHGGKMMQDPKGDALVSAGDSISVIELPPMEKVIGDLESLKRDSYHGAWKTHSVYGPSLRPDGSLIVSMYLPVCGANITGWLPKTVRDF